MGQGGATGAEVRLAGRVWSILGEQVSRSIRSKIHSGTGKTSRRRTFQDEYREFLERHGIEYDERYLW
jgi:hypothetical protein